MEIEFLNLQSKNFDKYESVFCDLNKKIIDTLNIDKNYTFSVTIVDNNKIHEINKEYRNVDRPTDVITFAFMDAGDEEEIKGIPFSIGEIIISSDKAEEQAKEYGHSLDREMSFLYVHGVLHLLGYDHMKKEDEEIMFGLQNKILGERILTK